MQEKGYIASIEMVAKFILRQTLCKKQKASSTHHGYFERHLKTPYKQYTLVTLEIQYLEKLTDTANVDVKEYENAIIKRIDDQYKSKSTLETDYVEKR